MSRKIIERILLKRKALIKPGKIFDPPKPSRITGKEQQTIGNAVQALKDEDFPLYCSPKRDGARYVLHKAGGKIRIISDDGKDATDSKALAPLKEFLEGWGASNWILDVEMELWSREGHWPREACAGEIHLREPEGRGTIVANCFACYWWEGKGLSDQTYEENWKFLKGLKIPQTPKKSAPSLTKPPLALIWHELCGDREQAEKWIRGMSDWPGSEGVVMKRASGQVPFPWAKGRSRSWLKYHKSVVSCVEIIKEMETKGPAHVYEYGVFPGDLKPDPDSMRNKLTYVGRTFGTSEKFEPGDRALIEAEQVNHYASEAGHRVTFWVPKVLGPCDEAKADTIPAVIGRARRAGILVEREKDEIVLEGKVGPGRGWWGPPKGTHVGEGVPAGVLPARSQVMADIRSEMEALRGTGWAQKPGPLRMEEIKQRLVSRYGLSEEFQEVRTDVGAWLRSPSSEGGRRLVGEMEGRLQPREALLLNKWVNQFELQRIFGDPSKPEAATMVVYRGGDLPGSGVRSFSHDKDIAFEFAEYYVLDMPDYAGDDPWAYVWHCKVPIKDIWFDFRYVDVGGAWAEKESLAVVDRVEVLATGKEIKAIRQPFGSPGGKRSLASELLRYVPEHKVYCEPFVGGGALFFHKSPEISEVEVLGDLDKEIIFAYRFLRDLTEEQEKTLGSLDWIVGRKLFESLRDSPIPSEKIERFWRFFYLKYISYGGMGQDYAPRKNSPGESKREGDDVYKRGLGRRIWHLRDRLKGVKLRRQSYWKTIEEFDGPDTFFYLNPPYEEQTVGGRHGLELFNFDWEEFAPRLDGIQGKWMCSNSWNDEQIRRLRKKGYSIRKVSRKAQMGTGQTSQQAKTSELLFANFLLPAKKGKKEDETSFQKELKATDSYMEIPSEKWRRYVVHHHWRGKGAHADPRFQLPDFLIGWTWSDMMEGAVKKPVLTLKRAKELDKRADNWKINWSTGQFKERRVRGGIVRKTSIYTTEKKREPCFLGQTPIWTRLGLRMIEDIRVGDEVLAADGSWTDVVFTMRRDVPREDLYRLKANRGFTEIIATGGHPVLTSSGKFEKIRELAGQPKRNTDPDSLSLVMPRPKLLGGWPGLYWLQFNQSGVTLSPQFWPVGYDLGYFIGCLLGDGSFGTDTITFSIDKKRTEVKETLCDLIRIHVGRSPIAFDAGGYWAISFNDRRLSQMLRARFLGSKAHRHSWQKMVDCQWLQTTSAEFLKGFVNGLVDTDGWEHKGSTFFGNSQLSLVSALIFAEMLRGNLVGYGRTISKKWDRLFEQFTTHKIWIKRKFFEVFPEKFELRLTQCELIRPRGNTRYVYNLETLAQTYCVSNFAVHNCEWIDFEGVVPKGSVGATKRYPGVFSIVDKGQVFFGAQKSWAHEYFLRKGKLQTGKYLIRALGKLGASMGALKELDLLDLCHDEDFEIAYFARQEFQQGLDELGVGLRIKAVEPQSLTNHLILARIRGEHKESRRWLAERLEEAGFVDWSESVYTPWEREREGQKVLPPAEEVPGRGFTWLTIQAVDQTPYVLTNGAKNKNWLPPPGISALPPEVRKKVPAEFNYWKKGLTRKQRLERRAELIEAKVLEFEEKHARCPACGFEVAEFRPNLRCPECGETLKPAQKTLLSQLTESQIHRAFTVLADGLCALGYLDRAERIALSNVIGDTLEAFGEAFRKKMEAGTLSDPDISREDILALLSEALREGLKAAGSNFWLIRRWSRGPIQIRFGPTEECWDLWVDGKLLVLAGDPMKEDGVLVYEETFESYDTEKGRLKPAQVTKTPAKIKPDTPANPSKETPAWIELLDGGRVVELDSGTGFVKWDFKGKRLKGARFYSREDPESEFWSFAKSGGPGTTLRDRAREARALLSAMSKFVKGDRAAISVWKDSKGVRRYTALCSAELEDLEYETVTEQAMDYSIELCQRHEFKPFLTIGHVPWSRVGRSLWEIRLGPFWVEGGRFFSGWLADQAFTAIREDVKGEIKISIGFLYPVASFEKRKYGKLFRYESTLTRSPALPITAIGVSEGGFEDASQ